MTSVFTVEKIHCDACARRVTNAVLKVAPTAKVAVDVKSGRVTVDAADVPAGIAEAITAAGYPAKRAA
jgi:copper chaperone